jgi:hypothetical protein
VEILNTLDQSQLSTILFAVNNVEYIYRLADEYQTDSVIESCTKFLKTTKITSENVMKMLAISKLCQADELHQQCYDVLQQCTIEDLESKGALTDLDEDGLRSVLLQKAKGLENCMKEVLPQFIGMIDCVLYLWLQKNNENMMDGSPTRCPVHHSSKTNARAETEMNTRLKCHACKAMFTEMAKNSRLPKRYRGYGIRQEEEDKDIEERFYSSTQMYFDENLVSVLQKMFDLLKTS